MLLTEKELLDIVDTLIRDRAYNRPAAVAIAMAVGAAVEAEISRRWRENSNLKTWLPLTAERLEKLEAENAALKSDLQYARDGLTKGRSRMREDNERLAREAHTWSKAAETYAAELERHKPLMQAVEWLLDDGHMNTEHLARLRATWEAALGPNLSIREP